MSEMEPNKKKKIFTIPNLISFLRLLVLPVIIWVYVWRKDYLTAIILLALSGLSDIVDGKIARRFNMISDLGKVLDPIADKFTQGALVICLMFTYPKLWILLAAFVLKEIIVASTGYTVIRRADIVPAAEWFGKANTVVLFTAIMFLLLAPLWRNGQPVPDTVITWILVVCCASLTVSMVLYLAHFFKILRETKEKRDRSES